MMILAILLATLVDPQAACAKYATSYQVPRAAIDSYRHCTAKGLGCDLQLAQRFANGKGVQRSFELAEYFLCQAESEMVVSEFEGMWEHVRRMRAGEETASLSFCHYAASGFSQSFCANMRWEERMPELDAIIAAVRKRIAAKTHLDALRKRAEAYVRAESERIGEQANGGTAYASAGLHAEIDAKELFVKNLERWTTERAPAATPADEKRADEELNATYRAVQETIAEGGEDIATWKTFLRDAQRAWITYRDAFATCYAAHWKDAAPPETLRREIITQLTRDRTNALKVDAGGSTSTVH